jgi:hypothetical protein
MEKCLQIFQSAKTGTNLKGTQLISDREFEWNPIEPIEK